MFNIHIYKYQTTNKVMNNLNLLKQELLRLKEKGITDFKIPTGDVNLNIDDFIKEIDGIKLCQCPNK